MISVKEAANILNISPVRLKQIIKEEKYEIQRESNKYIKIPTATMKKIRTSRGLEVSSKIASIAIEKGGVGKTILTLNTAAAAAKRGYRTCILDLDPEACSTLFLAKDDTDFDKLGTILEVYSSDKNIIDFVTESRFDGIDFLASKSKIRRTEKFISGKNPKNILKQKMQGLRDMYDLVLLDLPPSYLTLQQTAYLSSDIIIFPINNDVFCLDSLNLTLEDIEETCEQFEAPMPPYKVLRNRYSKLRRNTRETTTELMRDFGDKVLPFQIKNCAAIENSLNDGKMIFDVSGEADVKSAFEDLLDCIIPHNSKELQQ